MGFGAFQGMTKRRKYKGWHALVITKQMCLSEGESSMEHDYFHHLLVGDREKAARIR